MKLLKYEGSLIETKFAGKDYFRLASPVEATAWTDEGVWRWKIKEGFPTNMRSGSDCINCIIPKFTGNNLYNLAIVLHDVNYSKMKNGQQVVSKKLADDFLDQMLKVSGTLSAPKRWLMITALKLFGGSAYDASNTWDEEKYIESIRLDAI